MPSTRNVTYCTGLWLLQGNQKRSETHYLELIPKTCGLIASKRLVLHCDDEQVKQLFGKHAHANNVDLEIVTTPIEALPFSRYAPAIVECCSRMDLTQRPERLGREKGPRHYWNHYRTSGRAAYEKMIAIWLSKIPLTHQLANCIADGANAVAWIDSSIARFRGQRTNWRFSRIRPSEGRVQHYASAMTFRDKLLPINASFLQADRTAWARLAEQFEAELQSHLSDSYAHDEETILSFCEAADPSLFETVGRPHKPLRGRIRRLHFG